MKIVCKLPLMFAVSAVCAGTAAGEWISSASYGDYCDVSNWRSGIIDDMFSGNSISGRLEVCLSADRKVSDSGLYIMPENDADFVLEGSGGPRGLLFSGASLTVDIGGASARNNAVRIGNRDSQDKRVDLDFGESRATVVISPDCGGTGGEAVSLYGSIYGKGFSVSGCPKELKLYGCLDAGGGSVEVFDTPFMLYGWGVQGSHGILNASSVRVAGSGAYLSLQNTLEAGEMLLEGCAGFQSTAGVTNTAVRVCGGRSIIDNRGCVFMFDRIVCGGDGVVTFGAPDAGNLGESSIIRVSAAEEPGLIAQLTGGTGDNGTDVPILPWAGAQSYKNVEYISNNTYFAPSLPVTYDEGVGFRAVTTGEMANGLENGGASDNVFQSGSASLSADAQCNSLTVDASEIDLGGNTLRIGSGLILHRNSKPTFKNGTIDAGDRPLILRGRQNISISSRIVSGGGSSDSAVMIADTPAGGVSLSGDNSGWRGVIRVLSGNFTAYSENSVPPEVSVELAYDAVMPMTWNAFTYAGGGLGGSGTIAFGDGRSCLVVGSGEQAAGGVVVGGGGWLAPGSDGGISGGVRSGCMKVGENVSKVIFQDGGELRISVSGTDSSTCLDAGKASVFLGGGLVVSGRFPDSEGSWVIVRTEQDPDSDTITGAFHEITPRFYTEMASLGPYGTFNALILKKTPGETLLLVR